MSVKPLPGQLSCDFTQDNTQFLQLSLVGRRILDTSFYSKITADCSKNVMLHDIKHSQMAQMSLYNSFFQNPIRLNTNMPVQRPLDFSKLASSQNLNGQMNYFNKFNSQLQQLPRIQGTSDYSSFSTLEKHNNNYNNELCLLSDETLSFDNELSSPAKTPFFCKLEDVGNCNGDKELSSPDTKDTNENSPVSLVSDSKQTKITKNILFYKNHFLITSNPNLPKLDLPECEDIIPKIKHEGITESDIRFGENSANQNRLRSQIKSLNLFINYSEISTDRSEDSLNLFCEESYDLDDILLKNDYEENVQACTKEERLAKILKYKNKIRKWRSSHPVNKRFNGRSSVATKKPRIKGKFVTSEKYLEFLELQSPNEQTPCQ